jgi:allophanate hydrolase
MDITSLHHLYNTGASTPESTIAAIYDRIAIEGLHPIWLSLVPRDQALARASSIDKSLPLYGIPFAVKDNIDVAGLPTTAACAEFAYTPTTSATVVQQLEAAGAILIGKTNMDQFATGLVGTRSPFGICSSVFSKDHISGGSSAGSAVAVANGTVAFSLGTDTAGSGRIPAMFNNLIGLKPTRGVLSAYGVVPACRTLDCVSIFAETSADAAAVLAAARGLDPLDSYSRTAKHGEGAAPWAGSTAFCFGVPATSALNFFGDTLNPELYQQAVAQLTALGGEPVEIDLEPFLATARLLYQGPWIAERYAALESFIEKHAAAMDPTVGKIILGAKNYSAVDAFNATYKLEALRRTTAAILATIDVLVLPTAPRTYTIAEVQADPIALNSNLGTYTNFVNLLDLAAVAVPAGIRSDGLPFGVTLIGPAFTDVALLTLADRLHRAYAPALGGSAVLNSPRQLAETPHLQPTTTPPGTLLMAVVGAHLTGQPLNWQLTQRKGRLVRTTRTHPDYKFYALANTTPAKPGLVRVTGYEGPGIEVEIWALPEETVGSFVAGVPQPLGIGQLRLEDGTTVMGFIAEPAALEGATEITHFGGWRNYLTSLK